MNKFLACGLVAFATAGCTPQQIAQANVTIAQAEQDAQLAVDAYEAILGIAQVAEKSNPGIANTLNPIEAKAGPIVAQLQPLETDANADATAVEALVTQLQQQITQLTVAASPSVKVIGR